MADLLYASRFTPYAISAVALVLIGCAVTQEEEPRRPRSIAEARERLLWRPVKASYHLSVIGRVGDQAPLDWQLREYRAALWIQPTNPYIRDKIAEILMAMGEREQALKEMTLSVAHAPNLVRHEYLSADSVAELSADERDAVEAGFMQALAWNYPEAFQGLAEFYARQERFADQAALYEQAAIKETDGAKKSDLLINAGLAYLHAERATVTGHPSSVRNQKAASTEQRAASRRAEASQPASFPASQQSRHASRLKPYGVSAERAFRAAIAASPADPKPYHHVLTTLFAAGKDLEAAKELVGEGIRNGVPALPLYLSLAETAHKSGDPEESKAALKLATAEVDQLIKKGESPHALFISLADGARRAGDRDQEAAALLKALDLQPRSPETLSRLANVYLQKQNFDRAALYLNRISQINPDAADVYYNLAVAEEARYRFADAGRAYSRALELAPQNASYRERYEEFKLRVERNRELTSIKDP